MIMVPRGWQGIYSLYMKTQTTLGGEKTSCQVYNEITSQLLNMTQNEISLGRRGYIAQAEFGTNIRFYLTPKELLIYLTIP